MDETQITDSSRDDAGRVLHGGLWRLVLSLLLCGSLSGCAMFRENHYMASTVPPQLAALPISNPQVLNFAELTGTPSNSQMIGKLDVLEVNVLPSLNSREAFRYSVRVGEDGVANLDIGQLQLAGLELAEAEALITQASIERGLYRAPHITVTMKNRKVNRVFVSGAVKKPGWYEIPAPECNLISAIFYAGGLAPDAGTSIDIQNVLTRDELLHESIAKLPEDGVTQTGGYARMKTPRQATVDLISATKEGRDAYFVGDGGAINVERRNPDAIYVGGLVNKPGRQIFPLDDEEYRLLEAIAASGGQSSQVADKVFVVRVDPGTGQPAVIQASIRKAKHDEAHNLLLAPGDFVSVEHTPATVVMEVLRMIRIGASVTPFLL